MHKHRAFSLFFLILLNLPFISSGQNGDEGLPAYRLADEKGNSISYRDLVNKALEADVVLFGELHDDPIGHWLQLRLTRALYKKKGEELQLGAEMYEASDQLILDEYLNGYARMKDLKRSAKLWDNFDTDYRPVLKYARRHSIPFLASNVPRRYAALVHRKGRSALDSLSEEALRYMAEDFTFDSSLTSYQQVMKMGHGGGKRIAQAQALKDATMASRIHDRYEKGELFLHFNGSFHSDAHEGIAHYLKKELPKAKILVISSLRVKDVKAPKDVNWERKGDINLLVPMDMTSTH